MRILYSMALIVLVLSGCSSHHWFPNIDSEKECTDQGNNKFKKDGHISTTHIVAKIANLDALKAERYALFSQVPDEQWFLYSAPSVSVWATFIPWEWDYRYEINSILHSLHGGNEKKIIERRKKLIKLINKNIRKNKDENDWKIGFLIHALGDSYAHVYKESNSSPYKAYNHYIGHIWKKGIFSPDSIKDNNKNYIKYVRALYEALNIDNGDKEKLENYISYIENIIKIAKKEKESDEFVSNKIIKYKVRENKLNYCEHLKWYKEVNKTKLEEWFVKVKKELG